MSGGDTEEQQALAPVMRGIAFAPGYRLAILMEPSGIIRGFPQVEDLPGWPAEHFIGRHVADLAAAAVDGPERAARWRERLEVARTEPTAQRYEDAPMAALPGSVYVAECTVTPIRDGNGRLQAILAQIRDRSATLEVESRLRASEEQLRVALAVTGLGRFTTHFRENRIVTDERFARIFGSDPQEVMTREGFEGLVALTHEDDVERVRRGLDIALGGGADYDVEYRWWRPNGGAAPELRWVAAQGRVEFDDEGPVRLVGVVDDITDRVADEESRLRAQKRELVGTMAGGIAHDVNNVLSAILSNAALGEAEVAAGHSPSTSLAEIKRGAERAAEVVSRLLSVSHAAEPVRVAFDLGAVAREVCGLIRPTLPRSTDLKLTIQEGLPPVCGDASQLHQVLMNLIRNAGQAIGLERGTIEVTLAAIEGPDRSAASGAPLGPGQHVRLAVRDDGCGISDGVADRMFDPFFTTKEPGEGTGLGLSAAQTVVRGHGGIIDAATRPGGPTTFTVHLPAGPRSAAAPSADPPPSSGAETPTQPPAVVPEREPEPADGAAPVRVLFVDDEPALGRLAERALPYHGCVATVFDDPAVALEAFTQDPGAFDVLVTDLSMPGMDGFALVERIRAVRPGLPVVMTSGFLTAEDRAQVSAKGVNTVVGKPCSLEELAAAVISLCGGGDPA